MQCLRWSISWATSRARRAHPLVSDRLGLISKADIVESPHGTPYPDEYKHRPRRQLTGHPVPLGNLSFQQPPASRNSYCRGDYASLLPRID
jgi:hypothetical protein